MGALLFLAFIPACGRASCECVKKKRALFSCIEGGLRRLTESAKKILA